MTLRISLLLLAVSFLSGLASAQQSDPTQDNLVWFSYSNRAKISAKWTLTGDVGYRTHDFLNKKFQWLVRPGVSYQLSKRIALNAGYAYFETNQYLNGYEGFMRPEHRLWQRVSYTHSLGRFEFRHRIRLEERFNRNVKSGTLQSGYTFFYRTGYQLYITCPLNSQKIGKGTLYAFLYDELFLNFGKPITHAFDQNRIGSGFGYQVSKPVAVLLFYQYIYGEQVNTPKFYSFHVLNVAISHSLDFTKKTN